MWGAYEKVSVEASLNLIGAIIPPWRGVPSAMSADKTHRLPRPVFATLAAHAEGDLGCATASYEAHPDRPPGPRPCSAVSKTVPQYQMRKAHSTTPGEDPPQLDPRSTTPRRTRKK